MFQIGEDRLELLQNLYVANVRNRLRELETPDIELQKRWIWELIQNAKDCSKEATCFIKNPEKLPFTRPNQSVDIKITYDKSKKIVIFMHNGFPFTNRTLDSLMYKNSSKEGEEDNTGRFGTGFMTSHTLSRVVPINGPFLSYNQEKWELLYISAIIYREGNSDKQLKQEFVKMEKSKKCFQYDPNNKEHQWTKFTYQLTDGISTQSAELGIQSFRENIMEVLLFCDEINSIQLNDEDPIFTSTVSTNNNLTQTLVKQNIFKNIQVIEKTIFYSKQRKFIVAAVDDPNKKYSEKYSKDHDKDYVERKLKYSIAFEVDSKHNLVNLNANKICLFCTFPLIGSEKYQFPFLLNSPHFETFTERNGIILEGSQVNSKNILTNTGLNYLIINNSIELFKILLQWLIQNNYTNFACFSNGLIFDDKTLPHMKPFLVNLREILENSKIIHNSDNNLSIFKQTFILDFNNVKDPNTFHSLSSQFYSNVASFDECKQWQNKTWEKIPILKVETFVIHIEQIGKETTKYDSSFKLSHKLFKNGLKSLQNNDLTFLNKFYAFLLNEESENTIKYNSIFYKYNIVLNSNDQFTALLDLKSDSYCSKDFKKLMELCPSWKNKIIHPQINCFEKIIFKVTMNDAVQEIDSEIDKNRNNIKFLLSFIRYTLKNNEHRMKMYRVAKLFYDVPKEITLFDVDEKLWLNIDSTFLKHCNELINKERGKKCTKSLEDLNIFYELFQKFFYNSDFLVPNVNLNFIEKNKLGFISSEIEPVLLEALGPSIDLTQYAHPSITSVNFKKVFNLDSLIQTISSKDFYFHEGAFLDNHLFSVLSIIPPKSNERLYNFQMNIFKLASFFFSSNIKMVQTKVINELFWKKANEVFLDGMTANLLDLKNISNIKSLLKVNEETIFDKLNLYYEVLTINDDNEKKKNAIIPNYKSVFLKAENLFLSNGISDDLFDFYNIVQPESDIREKFAHPKVKCNFLNIIDFKQFMTSISEGISDDQLVNDSKIWKAISKLKSNDSIQGENEILLQKLYVANIKNRLNEIKNPTENDKIRWPWELIQNAKDSIYSPSNTQKQKNVEIFISIINDPKTNKCAEIKFSHNGPAFTENSFIGLLYKISQEKENEETTGRFGTGFISTHVLSKIVQIKSNRVDRKGKISGFSATLYREGTKDNDIIDNFKAMQKSQKINLAPFPFTEFYYKIKSEESRECVKLGLQHLKDHISTALINSPEIKFIVIDENGHQTKYIISEPVMKNLSNINYYIYDIYENSNIYQRFVVLKNKEYNANISVEIDEQNKIVPINNKMECLSIVFPLVGSYLHVLPFYLNSTKFEPSTERNALILNGKAEINGSLTNTGINRLILMKSIDLYKDLITIFVSNKFTNIYELSRGLILTKEPYYTFDLSWYQNNFLKNMKEILSNNIYVNTELGKKVLLKDAFFPSKKIAKEILPHFVYLSSRYYKNIVCIDDAIIWVDRIWNELSTLEISDLIHQVENDSSLFDDTELSFLNDFLSFIWYVDRNILYDHKLIPDMNNKMHCLSKEKEKFDLKESKTVQGQIIDIMESIGINWKSTHMNHKINSISLPEDKIIDAESRIIEKIKENNEMCFEIIKFVLRDNAFRINMFNFATILDIPNFSPTIVDDINPSIWEFADNYVLNQIVLLVSKFPPNKVQLFIDFFIAFLPFYQTYQKDEDYINSVKIFPNANYVLHSKKDLKNKSEDFHDFLNPVMTKFYDKDLNNDILHPEINKYIKLKQTESLNDILTIINDKIDYFSNEKKLMIAETVLCLIPQEENSANKQEQIFFLYQALIKQNIEGIPISSVHYIKYKWDKSNDIIIEFICSKIEETKNLNNFKRAFSLNDFEICFTILNALYPFAISFLNKHKIIPDQKGEFKLKRNLKEDPGINDDILECISYFKLDSIIQYDFADKRVQIDHLDKIKVLEFYKDLNSMFKEALKQKDIDYKVVELIKKINHIDDKFYDIISSKELTEDQKARIKILQNAHVQFIENRLREINTPSNKDFKRWPFELIQNANDTLFSSGIKDVKTKRVKILFEFNDTKVIFSHNGLPFTNDSLFALLYQCSEGKRNDPRSTGKFGTGFLSTHILSKTIKISGDIQSKNGEISGFNVTIFRNGKSTDELIEGVQNMEKSLQKDQKVQNLTTFEFILPNDENSKKAYEDGLLSLKSNVGPVLIFNPTIESITIKTKNETLSYVANHEKENIQTISLIRNSESQVTINKYICCKSKESFNQTTLFDIHCLLPINNRNEIMKVNDEVLFISYPMFDDIRFNSPIIINSPNFEPDKERNCIIFQSKDIPIECSESLINKFIISKSANLLNEMLKIATKMNCSHYYNISAGLSLINKSIPVDFIEEKFYRKMKDTLLSFPIFKTSQGMKKINEVIFPFFERNENFIEYNTYKEQYFITFYNLVSRLKIDSCLMVDYNSCLEWSKYVWFSFPSKFTIQKFISLISENKNLSDLKLNQQTKSEKHPEIIFIRDVILFILNMNNYETIFKSNSILIDEKWRFASSNDILYFNLHPIFLEMFDIVKFDYKDKKINREIEDLFKDNYSMFRVFSMNQAIEIIRNNINEENAILFMKYIIKDDVNRKKIFEYTKFFLDDSIESVILPDLPINADDFKRIFRKADKIIYNKLISKVQTFDIQKNIEYFLNFFNFLKDNLSYEEFHQMQIFPNQKYKLCLAKQLKIDDIQDENVKIILENTLNIDLKSGLLLNDLADTIILEHQKMADISDKIYSSPEISNIKLIDKILRYKFYSIIFQYSEKNEDNDQFINILHFFFNVEILSTPISNGKLSYKLTYKVTQIAINEIIDFISRFSTFNELASIIEFENKQSKELIISIFNNLSLLYKFTTRGKIFPNKKNQFVELNDIYWLHDQEVDNEKMEILLNYFVQFSQSDEIEHHILNYSIDVCDSLQKIIRVIDLKYLSKEIMKFINQNDKKLYMQFLKFVRSTNELKNAFSPLLTSQYEERFDQIMDYLIDSEDEKECCYIGQALVYEMLMKSKKFSVVIWPSKSDVPTNLSITLENGNKYFISEKNNQYDIYAEDLERKKFLFIVKSSKDDGNENRFSFYLNSNQFDFADDLNESDSHFVLALVKNALHSPRVLFLTKQNELFTL